jgi:hypothetical protein
VTGVSWLDRGDLSSVRIRTRSSLDGYHFMVSQNVTISIELISSSSVSLDLFLPHILFTHENGRSESDPVRSSLA